MPQAVTGRRLRYPSQPNRSFNRPLDGRLGEMVPVPSPAYRVQMPSRCRKDELPEPILGSTGGLPVKRPWKPNVPTTTRKVALVQPTDSLQLNS
jgi:hypothetical protein